MAPCSKSEPVLNGSTSGQDVPVSRTVPALTRCRCKNLGVRILGCSALHLAPSAAMSHIMPCVMPSHQASASWQTHECPRRFLMHVSSATVYPVSVFTLGPAQVCFLGPELGPLESLLVAPEGGDWYLEEANVSSSRTGHSDRCAVATTCRPRLNPNCAMLLPCC